MDKKKIEEVMALVNRLSAEAFREGANVAKGMKEDAMECFYMQKNTKSEIVQKLRQLLGEQHG